MATHGERQSAERVQRATPKPASTTSSESTRVITHLQRTIGNRAVQRLVDPEPTDTLATQIRDASGGRPLEASLQRELESGLGTDLSDVRVHTDARADALSREVNATAFTSGPHIFFRAGAYDPGSTSGRRTVAHEAVHTIQQASGPVDGTPQAGGVTVSSPDDRYERAADATAAEIISP